MSPALNSRWVAYVATNQPATAYGFIIWINAHWRRWEALHGRKEWQGKSKADHAAFDLWLASAADGLEI